MDLFKATEAIDRAQLWTTLYKKGIPLETIIHIRRGRQKILAKDQGKYGKNIHIDVGVFLGSAIRALLFTIYLYDMMGGYRALNRLAKPPKRMTLQRNPTIGNIGMLKNLQEIHQQDTEENITTYMHNRTTQHELEAKKHKIHDTPPPDTEYIRQTIETQQKTATQSTKQRKTPKDMHTETDPQAENHIDKWMKVSFTQTTPNYCYAQNQYIKQSPD